MSETIIFTDKFKDEISMSIYGRSYSLAKAGNQCVSCGKSADTFSDNISRREYQISCLCQICQDEVFQGMTG